MPFALLTLLAAAPVISLKLDGELKCPTHASLSDRLARVGLSVKPPNAPATDVIVAPPAFEVSMKPTPVGLSLTARRASDGKVFERNVEAGREDCPTVERLVVVLIHSWIHAKMPVLSPTSTRDAGQRR
jgi:hypothetical protein